MNATQQTLKIQSVLREAGGFEDVVVTSSGATNPMTEVRCPSGDANRVASVLTEQGWVTHQTRVERLAQDRVMVFAEGVRSW